MVLPPTKQPHQPSLPWRVSSSLLMGLTCAVSRAFLFGLNKVETVGLEGFVELLESRRDVEKRQRGLITVSNHISILDDPLIWGLLPLKYAFDPANLRWSLAAHDICFKNPILTRFFTIGQTLPTYRLRHSPYGGLFQPTMTDAIRLLSSPQHAQTILPFPSAPSPPPPQLPAASTTHAHHAWVHVFPEACVHQETRTRGLRYFKWGAARLILESGPEPPDVVPVFVDGTDRIMSEDRGFPRFVPRAGRTVRVVFGAPLDRDAAFGDLRSRWDALVAESKGKGGCGGAVVDLEHGEEARAIRIEVARRLRDEVLKLRRGLGYPDEEDPRLGLAETWAREPGVGYTYRSRVDGSAVNEKM